jgi:hypothetical protein
LTGIQLCAQGIGVYFFWSSMAHFLRLRRKKPGYPLQSFGYAKRISASIPCAPKVFFGL